MRRAVIDALPEVENAVAMLVQLVSAPDETLYGVSLSAMNISRTYSFIIVHVHGLRKLAMSWRNERVTLISKRRVIGKDFECWCLNIWPLFKVSVWERGCIGTMG